MKSRQNSAAIVILVALIGYAASFFWYRSSVQVAHFGTQAVVSNRTTYTVYWPLMRAEEAFGGKSYTLIPWLESATLSTRCFQMDREKPAAAVPAHSDEG